jgi:hypothetical protein
MSAQKQFFPCLLYVLLLLSGCGPYGLINLPYPREYSAEPIEAWVIDGKTKQPIEGVIVLAVWQMEGGPIMEVMETLTDAKGRFYFPGWGPRPVPPDTPSYAHFGRDDPRMYFYEQEYSVRGAANSAYWLTSHEHTHRSVRYSEVNGDKIDMWRIKAKPDSWNSNILSNNLIEWKVEGGMEEWASNRLILTNLVGYIMGKEPCLWTRVTKMAIALSNENELLRKSGKHYNSFMLKERIGDEIKQTPGCPSPEEFFKERGKMRSP